jgi:hypothetical protein
MKKVPLVVIPWLFATLPLALFFLLFRPALDSLEMTSACLVFLTALGWSALIVFGRKRMHGLKTIYAATALLASILLIRVFRPFPVDPLQHRLMVGLQALGMAGIIFYLHILKKKGEDHHD